MPKGALQQWLGLFSQRWTGFGGSAFDCFPASWKIMKPVMQLKLDVNPP